MTKKYDEVVIIGGGIAGLAAALSLAPQSERLTILEALSEEKFHDVESGAALQLSDNGLRALEHLSPELLQKVLLHSVQVQKNYIIMSSRGELYDTMAPVPPQGIKTMMIRWGILRKLLFEAIPKDVMRIEFNTLAKDYTDGILTTVKPGCDEQHCERYHVSNRTLLVAADGSRSAFRPTPIQYSPRLNIKAVIQFSGFPSNFETHSTYSYLGNPDAACFLGPAGPDHLYWAISLATDQPDTMNPSIDQVISRLTAPETKIWRDLIQATPAHKIFTLPSAQAEIPQEMAHNNVVLVGDAAHCMSGSYGQSACLALEDAVTVAAGLQNYSSQRRQRCLDLQVASQQRATQAVNDKSEPSVTISDWIYKWDVPTSSQSEDFANSFVVVG